MADIRDGIKLPDFLQALPHVVRNDIDNKTPIEETQAFKERAPEQVRWRSVSKHIYDLKLVI